MHLSSPVNLPLRMAKYASHSQVSTRSQRRPVTLAGSHPPRPALVSARTIIPSGVPHVGAQQNGSTPNGIARSALHGSGG